MINIFWGPVKESVSSFAKSLSGAGFITLYILCPKIKTGLFSFEIPNGTIKIMVFTILQFTIYFQYVYLVRY